MALHYIIDGYNLMKQIPRIIKGKKLFKDRDGFIIFLEHERPYGSRNNKVTVVFDGREDVSVSPRHSETEVVFTRGETADERIKRMIEKSYHKKDLVVISDDNEVKYFAKMRGIKAIGAEEFLAKIKERNYSFFQAEEKIDLETIQGVEITKELEKIWLKKEKQ